MFVYFKPQFLRILILSVLSGLPLALAASTLTTMLAESGLDLTTIGLFALVGMPYTIKFLWAPIVDNYNIPLLSKIGRRKSWITLCSIFLFINIFIISFINPQTYPFLIALFALGISISSATFDIVFDAYRIESLTKEEQAAGASTYVLGYRLGMLTSNAGALYLAHFYGWELAYQTMALLIPLCLLTLIFSPEPLVQSAKKKPASFTKWLQVAYFEPLADFVERHQAWRVLLFVALFKLGDAYAGMMTNPFLITLGFSKIEIANIVKGIGLGATLFGVFCGGLLAARVKMHYCLFITLLLQSISNLLFIVQYQFGHNDLVLVQVICIENFVGGIGTSIFMSYLASLCNTKFTATQYALLSSFALLGRTVISSSGGYTVDYFGWPSFFIISALLSLPALFLIKSTTGRKQKSKPIENAVPIT